MNTIDNPITRAIIQGATVINNYKKLSSKEFLEIAIFNFYIVQNEYCISRQPQSADSRSSDSVINDAVNLLLSDIASYIRDANTFFNDRQAYYHQIYTKIVKSKQGETRLFYLSYLHHLFFIDPLGPEPSDDILLDQDPFTLIEFDNIFQQNILVIEKNIHSTSIYEAKSLFHAMPQQRDPSYYNLIKTRSYDIINAHKNTNGKLELLGPIVKSIINLLLVMLSHPVIFFVIIFIVVIVISLLVEA